MEDYCDNDWEDDKGTNKRLTGYVIFINGNPFFGLQITEKLSLESIYAEYNSIDEVCKEVLYIKYIMEFLDMHPKLPIIIHCDNIGAIFLSNNQESRLSKNLDIKVNFVTGYVEKGIVKIFFCENGWKFV